MTAILESLKWELGRHPLFEAMTDEDLDRFLGSARQVVFPIRKRIFAQGDESDCLYILLSGRVKVSVYSDSGKETVLAFMGENNVLGEMGVLDGGARSAAAIALEETRALQIHKRDIVDYLGRNPLVSMQIIATLSKRLRETNARLEDIATLPAAPRLARALLRLADQYGTPDQSGAIAINMKVSQGLLGAHVGLTRENVNRLIKAWENDGLISNQAGRITLLLPEELKKFGEE